MTQAELIKLFDNKLDVLKKELTDSFIDKRKNPRFESAGHFTFKSNKKQFEFNLDIQNRLEEVIIELTSSGLKEKLSSLVTKIKHQNNSIKTGGD